MHVQYVCAVIDQGTFDLWDFKQLIQWQQQAKPNGEKKQKNYKKPSPKKLPQRTPNDHTHVYILTRKSHSVIIGITNLMFTRNMIPKQRMTLKHMERALHSFG